MCPITRRPVILRRRASVTRRRLAAARTTLAACATFAALNACARPPAADTNASDSVPVLAGEPGTGPAAVGDAGAASVDRAPDGDTISGAVCDDRSNALDPERERLRAAAEAAPLRASAGRAERFGVTLQLRLADGRRVRFVDCPDASESWRHHEYAGLDAAGRGHLVQVSYYEGGETWWVPLAGGPSLPLAALPVFAPDGRHFAVANADLEAGYTDNVFVIYRVTATGAEEVHREAGGEEFGATAPAWRDAATVTFTRVHRASTPGQVLHLAVTATKTGDGWRVDPEPPPLP